MVAMLWNDPLSLLTESFKCHSCDLFKDQKKALNSETTFVDIAQIKGAASSSCRWIVFISSQ